MAASADLFRQRDAARVVRLKKPDVSRDSNPATALATAVADMPNSRGGAEALSAGDGRTISNSVRPLRCMIIPIFVTGRPYYTLLSQ